MSTKIFMVAGEASSDLHASALVRELKKEIPDTTFYGVGGKNLLAEGMDVLVPSETLNVVAIDFWNRAKEVFSAYRKLSRVIIERRPDCAVLLDLPDFNMKLARKLKKLGVPVVYYISPQVWAWRQYRIKAIRKYVDRMLVLFPFEKEFYDRHHVETVFVGHPLLDRLQPRESYRNPDQIKEAPRVALLPGSRNSELRHHAPIISQLVEKLRERYPEIQFKIPVAATLELEWVQKRFFDRGISFVREKAPEVLRWSDIAVVASGTATLETALVGTPFCLFYKVDPFSGFAMKAVIRYRGFFGMPNLLHGRAVVKEFIQGEVSWEKLFTECQRLIDENSYRAEMIQDLLKCRERLGVAGASHRAAGEVRKMLAKKESAFGSSLENAVTFS